MTNEQESHMTNEQGGDALGEDSALLGQNSPGGQMVQVTVVLPCYNEQDHVVAEVERICHSLDVSGYTYELLAIDDASTDKTLSLLEEAASRLGAVRLLPFRHNGGTGTARRIGTQRARGEIVVWTDADMTYPNERIPELVRLLDEDPSCDQVVGARMSEQGTHKVFRIPAKWLIRKLAEQLTNTSIPDLNSGLRAFRRSVALPYLRLLPPGFSCVTTITLAFLSDQHHIRYVPVSYARRSGTSKFHFLRDAYRYLLQVLRMVMYFNPLQVLMPIGLSLLGVGVLKGGYDMVVHPVRLAVDTVLIFLTGLIIGSLALLADLIVRSRSDACIEQSGRPQLIAASRTRPSQSPAQHDRLRRTLPKDSAPAQSQRSVDDGLAAR